MYFLFVPTLGICKCPDSEEFSKECLKAKTDSMVYYQIYKKIGGECDDGLYAEAASDATVGILGYKEGLIEVLKMCGKEKKFCDFVEKHIDGTVLKEDLERVIKNATTSCPVKENDRCSRIITMAKEALY